MEIEDITTLVRVFKESEIQEFELERDGLRLRLVRGVAGFSPAPSLGYPAVANQPLPFHYGGSTIGAGSGQSSTTSTVPENDDTSSLVKVESPIVGTFYRRPSPDAEVFAKEGDTIRKGATICIIEAMKLMNEIESPCTGKIEKVLLSDGEVVEFGEVLFYIRPEV